MYDPDAIDPDVLELAYDDLKAERDRLRDARAGFTKLLGPLPASAAIAIGLVGSAGSKVSPGWLAMAGVILAVLIAVGIVFGGLRPYRLLRAAHQGVESSSEQRTLAFETDASGKSAWLAARIALDEEICGTLRSSQHFRLTRKVGTLQDALDVERSAAQLVQSLFVALVAVLIAGLAMRGSQGQGWVAAGIGGITLIGFLGALAVGQRGRDER